ncbi:MAG: hypothetical protein EOP50_09570, partial [Sphingobacteriales bacterium]
MPTTLAAAAATPPSAEPFSHTPRPAVVCDSHPLQRYFGPKGDAVVGMRGAGEQHATADVWRHGAHDVARLGVQVGYGMESQAKIELQLDPAGLRDLAQ